MLDLFDCQVGVGFFNLFASLMHCVCGGLGVLQDLVEFCLGGVFEDGFGDFSVFDGFDCFDFRVDG